MSILAFAQIDVRVSFSRGFIGTRGTSNNSALAIKTFPTLGVTRAYFIQPSTTGFFTAQGNDIPGTVRLMLTSGSYVDIVGAINWRGPSGNDIQYFGFIPDPTISPVTLNLPGGGTYVINSNSNFGLLKNASTFTLTDNADITGNAAMNGVLDALNSYLTSQSVNGGTIGSNQTICTGSTPATLTSSTAASGGEGTLTYQWQQSTDNTTFTNVASGGTGATYSPGALTVTTYFRREATDGANSGYSNTITVTVTPATSAGTLSGTQTVCVAGTTTFSSTVNGGAWTSSNTNIATVDAASGVITGVAAGTATITYTVTGTGGCSNATTTRTVTVSAPPTAGTISGTTSFCVNGTSTLSSTVSGGTWTSSNTSIATVNASSGVVTGVAAGTATITYTVTGTAPCSSSTATATAQVTINSAGTAGTLSGTQNVCIGATTTFSSTVSGGTWTSSNTSIATVNASSGVVTGVAAGTATITYTVAGTSGCANATGTRSVTVEALPAAAVMTVTQPTCTVATGSITVTSPTGAGLTYSINGGTYQASVNFANLAAGSYVVRVKNAAGCVGANTTTATINAQPVTPATPGTISGSTTINSNSTQTYSVQAVTGATSYTWTLPSGWVGSSTTNSITVQTNSTSGTVSVVANANGCTSGASTLAVTINTVTDSDGDGIPDSVEGTGDVDGDGIPNYLDLDSDNDGIPDAIEVGPDPSNPRDTDGDGIPDYKDLDSDGDGIPDAIEGTVDTDGDGIPNYLDLDSDGDGIPDQLEGTTDTDGDGIPNYLDLDSDGDGIPDSIEDTGCNAVAPCTPTDTDGDGIPNYLDLDSDGDGIPDSIEAGPNPASPIDSDNDGTPDYLDLDSDGDGIPDSIEDAGCNGTVPCTPTDTDGDGIPNYLDLDSDGDGIPDSIEDAGCNGTAPCTPTDTDGDGIPNYLDLDSDGDGIPDAVEAGPNPASPIDSDNDGTPDYLDLDSDNDGIPDSIEDAGCNGTAPCTPTDTDGDGIPNYLDLDSDGDGIPDSVEDAGCNGTAPCTPTDTDGDGIPNYLDLDSDGDGIPDSIEAGPNPATPRDSDNDGIPDYLDLDSDNDGIPDSVEDAGCNGVAPCTPTDTDGDGIPNYLDLDSDNDGIPDSVEDAGCNGTAPCTPTDTDGDGIPNYLDLDSDNDGIPDSIEDAGCNGVAPCTPTDTDGDGIPNYLDLDSDNDGIPDSIEDAGCNGVAPCTPTDTDGDGIPNYLDLDSDNDGIPDSIEDAGCNGVAPCTPTDTDGDGIPNYLDLDSDNDGIPDSVEDAGCNGTAPCTPTDTDGDGTPDYLDLDSDNDGIPDSIEAGPSPATPRDSDNDGTPDYLDLDSDNDGIPDSIEDAGCNGVAPCTPTDTDGDGIPNYLDLDSDNDGIPDSIEDAGCNGTAPCTPTDTDGDGIPNYLDLDSDNDGILDAVEDNGCNGTAPCTPTDTDGDGIPNYLDLDSDGDGCSDANEAYNSLAAQGTDGNMYYGNGNPPTVNANGQVVGATYPTPGTNYITAGAAPVITGNPVSLTTSVGATINFSATASVSVGTVSYQWQVSTNNGTSWTNIALLAPYSGVTNSVLNINGVTASMQGYRYRVIAYQTGFICGADTSASATLTVNFPPDAVNDVVSVAEDVAITGNLLTNDTDANGDPLTVVSFVVGGYTYFPGTTATIPGVGTILINANGTYTFTPVPNYNGTVPPITYTISDGQGGTDTANLLITVTPVNDAPDAQNDTGTTLEDQPLNGNVLTNDTDIDGNPLTVTQFVVNGQTYTAGQTATLPGVGTIVINPNGTYTFTPAPNYNGAVPPITYTVSDGQGGTDTAILSISITPVNDAPVAQNDTGTTNEDQPLTGNVLTNDTDVDGNPLTVTQLVIGGISYPAGSQATIPGVGTIVINPNGTYTFTPAHNYNGTVPPIQYYISDGQGGNASATLQITVQAVADPEDIQVTSAPVCISGAVTLQASTTTVPNPVFRWYSDATLANLLFTGATYTTPIINATTNYYVTVSGTGVLPNIPGNAKVATATILPAPARPTITAMGQLVFCKDDSVVLKVSAASSYQWYKNGVAISGATSDTYVAKTEGDYTVVITNANGCSSAPSSPAAVRVPCTKGIYMPNVFTPNGDGKNDVVKPSIPGMKKFECFKVYNRWGNLVFECYNELRAWDGTLKGVIQPVETYIWVVQGQDGQGKPMRETGMITLTR